MAEVDKIIGAEETKRLGASEEKVGLQSCKPLEKGTPKVGVPNGNSTETGTAKEELHSCNSSFGSDESGQARGGLSAADAQALRAGIAERAADELGREIEKLALAVLHAPTLRERIASWLRSITTPAFVPPIHESRRPEVAALVAKHGAKMIAAAESGDDERLRQDWQNLANELRYGGFSMAAHLTPAALERTEQRRRDIHTSLEGLGYRADEIASAFRFAANDPAAFGKLSWDHIEINGRRIERRNIQCGCKPVWSKVSDEKWLSAFPKIEPPPAPPDPNWERKLIVQE